MGLSFSDVIEPGTKIKFTLEDNEHTGVIERIESVRSKRPIDKKKIKYLSKKSDYFQDKYLTDCYYVVSGLSDGFVFLEIDKVETILNDRYD